MLDFLAFDLKFPGVLQAVITLIHRRWRLCSIGEAGEQAASCPIACVCVCVYLRMCVLIVAHLKQGHVLAVVLLALLGGGIAAVDEGAALLRVTVTWRRRGEEEETHQSAIRRHLEGGGANEVCGGAMCSDMNSIWSQWETQTGRTQSFLFPLKRSDGKL